MSDHRRHYYVFYSSGHAEVFAAPRFPLSPSPQGGPLLVLIYVSDERREKLGRSRNSICRHEGEISVPGKNKVVAAHRTRNRKEQWCL